MAFPEELQGERIVCPHCHQLTLLGNPKQIPPLLLPATIPAQKYEQQKQLTTIKRVGTTFGVGCLIQIVALAVIFFFPIGTMLGIVLLIVGHSAAYHLECFTCGTKLNSKRVSVCPGCGSNFK